MDKLPNDWKSPQGYTNRVCDIIEKKNWGTELDSTCVGCPYESYIESERYNNKKCDDYAEEEYEKWNKVNKSNKLKEILK